MRTNQYLLCYIVVKYLTSILSYCLGSKCVSSNNDTKALSLCDNCFARILLNQPKNYLPTINNLLTFYVTCLSSMFSWCSGVKIVVSRKDPRALSHGDNHFDIISITLPENHLQTN